MYTATVLVCKLGLCGSIFLNGVLLERHGGCSTPSWVDVDSVLRSNGGDGGSALAFVLERRRLGTCTESAASSNDSALLLLLLPLFRTGTATTWYLYRIGGVFGRKRSCTPNLGYSKGRPLSGSVLGVLDLYYWLTTSRVNLQHGDGGVLERLRLSAIFYVSQ